MQYLLRNKELAFWTLQVAGWVSFGIIRLIYGITYYPPDIANRYYRIALVIAVIGFLISIIIRYVFRLVRGGSPMLVVITALSFCGGFAFVFSLLEVYAADLLLGDDGNFQGLQLFGNAMLDLFVLLSWTGLYFGINYYLMMQQEKEKALKASALAHQAQLKMLRYQLNPHFLFNTLNAISTLVLEKDVKPANDMLTRLSSFLRYTLVNQPNTKVTLDQELYALDLYLEIEKVRFQERLRLQNDISRDAREALIPSLLLQPLIENAIKYAIAPSETGGTVHVAARVENGMLCVSMEDDGPGFDGEVTAPDEKSSGVGIVNTKERLTQIYGDNHQFNMGNVDPHGVWIKIMIPCEYPEHPKKTKL